MLKNTVFACLILSCSSIVAAGPPCGNGEGYWDVFYRNVEVCNNDGGGETYQVSVCTYEGWLRRGLIPSLRTVQSYLPERMPWTTKKEYNNPSYCPHITFVDVKKEYDYLGYLGQLVTGGVTTYRGMLHLSTHDVVTRTKPVCRIERRKVQVFRCEDPR